MIVAHRGVAGAVAVLLSAACSGGSIVDDATTHPVGTTDVRSSSILLIGEEIVVVDPDVDSISVLDRTALQPIARIEVGDEPRQLLSLPGGQLVVSTHRGGELVFVDLTSRLVTSRVTICAGPFGMALRASGPVVVACEYDHRVVEWTPAGVREIGRVPRVRAVATSGDLIYAASFVGTGARVFRFDDDDTTMSTSPVPSVESGGRGTAPPSATQLTAILPTDDGGLWVAMQLVDNGPSDGPAGYGDIVDGNPRVRPLIQRLDSDLQPVGIGAYARFDGSERAFNAPSALEFGPDNTLVIAHRSSADVAILSADGRSVTHVARVGSGPAGLAVDLDARVVYVDNAFDGSVSRLDLSGGAPLTRVRNLPYRVSTDALAGRRTFHDSRDVHLTPLGVVACSTCHPEGADDGLTWDLHAGDVTPRRRRSMHLGVAPIGRAGLHWDGEFEDMRSLLASTIPNLMGGDGLLVDADDVSAYVTELVAPPPPRAPLERAEAGRKVFERAGCATCHSGVRLTDDRFHAVLSPMTTAPGDTLSAARTPSLLGIAHRAPYFHDGRSPDLDDLHRRTDATVHGADGVALLTDDDVADLVIYLESL
ncbi:MAG: c-type cytochrome [Myxococcales bacterium]|nr:c-type cytochrome [Myxococcales bacterium]